MESEDRQKQLIGQLLRYVAAADSEVFYKIAERYRYKGMPIRKGAGLKNDLIIDRIMTDFYAEDKEDHEQPPLDNEGAPVDQ